VYIKMQGVYERTEWHRQICKRNATIGSRITKHNLPKDTAGKNNPRWKGGRSAGFILDKCRKIKPLLRCEKCGTKNNLFYHHKNGIRTDNHKNNIAVVCKSCHAVIHNRIKNMPIKDMGTVKPYLKHKEAYELNRLPNGRWGKWS
jgi:hypothetical protein